ncbi:hypothetical protein GCM10009767_10870 [Kocuria aegyptia]|uniref:Uncharacterized protein n=1 Tax=Kocuria aegyptia TaxID=330943 RepID=A0ABP4WJM6_9MICC
MVHLGRSAQSMRAFAESLRDSGAGLRVLNLGGVATATATRVMGTAYIGDALEIDGRPSSVERPGAGNATSGVFRRGE